MPRSVNGVLCSRVHSAAEALLDRAIDSGSLRLRHCSACPTRGLPPPLSRSTDWQVGTCALRGGTSRDHGAVQRVGDSRPPKLRELRGDTRYFRPWQVTAYAQLKRTEDPAPEPSPPIDARESQLPGLFLRRYVTYCATARRYARM